MLVLAAHACSLVALPWRRIPWRPLLVAGSVLTLGLTPLAIYLSSSSSDGIGWASSSAGGRLVDRVQSLLPPPVGAAVVVVLVPVLAVALRRLRHSLPTDEPLRWWRLAMPLSWLFVPLVLAGTYSYFATPVLVPRYFVIVVPPLVLLIALGMTKLPRPGQGVALAVFGAVSMLSVARFYGQDGPEDWRAATAYVSTESVSGDAVAFSAPYWRIPFENYLERFPAARSQLEPVFPTSAWGGAIIDLVRPVPLDADQLEQGLDGRHHLWLVLADVDVGDTDPQLARLRRMVEQRFEKVAETHFTGITVLRYERSPSLARSVRTR